MKTKYAPLAVVLVVVTFFAVILATFVFLSSGSVFVADSGFSSGGQKPPSPPFDPSVCSGKGNNGACERVNQEVNLGGGAKCRCDRTSGSLCKCTPLAAPVDTSVKCPASPDNSPACNDKAVNSVQEYAPGRACTCQLNGSACGCVPNQKFTIGTRCTDKSECESGLCTNGVCANETTCTSGDQRCIGEEFNSCLINQDYYRCTHDGGGKCTLKIDTSCKPNEVTTDPINEEGPFLVPPTFTPTVNLSAIEEGIEVKCALGTPVEFIEGAAAENACGTGEKYGRICEKKRDKNGKTVSIEWQKRCIPVKEDKELKESTVIAIGKLGQICNKTVVCGDNLVCDTNDKTAGVPSIGQAAQQKVCVLPKGEKCDASVKSNFCIRGSSCAAEGQSFICK